MAVSYKRLWHLLIDRGLKKSDLEKKAGLTHYSLRQLSLDKPVSTDVIGKICETLDCSMEDVVEFIPDVREDAKL